MVGSSFVNAVIAFDVVVANGEEIIAEVSGMGAVENEWQYKYIYHSKEIESFGFHSYWSLLHIPKR